MPDVCRRCVWWGSCWDPRQIGHTKEACSTRRLVPEMLAFDGGDKGGEFGCTVTWLSIISDIVPAHANNCMMCAMCSEGCDVVCCAV